MRIIKYAAFAGIVALAVPTGCNSFLDSEKAVADPNNPTQATTNQLFVGTIANVFGQQEGPVAMNICEWMQQCAGTGGRFVETQGTYAIDSDTFDGSFQSIYDGGGLIQIRQVEANATAANDKAYLGIAEVVEAMNIWGVDIWGDMPYREAVAAAHPHFDPQQQIYADLLALPGQGHRRHGVGRQGPGAYDLIYGGSGQEWIEAAHTLKARIYLTKRRSSARRSTQRAERGQEGISTSANDWLTGALVGHVGRNLWAQFQLTSFGQDLCGLRPRQDHGRAEADKRLPDYFAKIHTACMAGTTSPRRRLRRIRSRPSWARVAPTTRSSASRSSHTTRRS
jgi:hypothetical protein